MQFYTLNTWNLYIKMCQNTARQKNCFVHRSIKTYDGLYSNEYSYPNLSCTNLALFWLLLLGLGWAWWNAKHKITKTTEPSSLIYKQSWLWHKWGALLNFLQLDNVSLRRKKLRISSVFKTPKGHTPYYVQNFFSMRSTQYDLRNSEMKLNSPK